VTFNTFHPDSHPPHSLISLTSTCLSVDRCVRSRRLPGGLRERFSRASTWKFSGKESPGGEVFVDTYAILSTLSTCLV